MYSGFGAGWEKWETDVLWNEWYVEGYVELYVERHGEWYGGE